MNDKELFQYFDAMFRTMSGEQNVLETMEYEGQSKAVNETMLAIEMKPEKKVWEKLGFSFSEIPGDDVLCKATLPSGWTLRATDHAMWNDIVDTNNNVRASMFYKAAFYDRSAHMNLENRYCINRDYINEDTVEISFGSKNEKLFVAGKYSYSDDDAYEKSEKCYQLAEDFANKNYPDWKNPLAYWDDDLENEDIIEKKSGQVRVRKEK